MPSSHLRPGNLLPPDMKTSIDLDRGPQAFQYSFKRKASAEKLETSFRRPKAANPALKSLRPHLLNLPIEIRHNVLFYKITEKEILTGIKLCAHHEMRNKWVMKWHTNNCCDEMSTTRKFDEVLSWLEFDLS
jgi:hypothetical protein